MKTICSIELELLNINLLQATLENEIGFGSMMGAYESGPRVDDDHNTSIH